MKRLSLLVLLFAAACAPMPRPPVVTPQPPPVETNHAYTFVRASDGAGVTDAAGTIALDDGATLVCPQAADLPGQLDCPFVSTHTGGGSMVITSSRFATWTGRIVLPPGTGQLSLPNGAGQVVLASAHADAGELAGPIASVGTRLVRADGSTYPVRRFTDFLLFQKFLRHDADLDAVLDDHLTCGGRCKAGQGPTSVRVLGMVDSFSHFYPLEQADYYGQLAAFADWLASRHVRFELTVFADSGIVMPDASARQAHLFRVRDVLRGHWNVDWIEVANEPNVHSNMPGGGDEAYRLCRSIQGTGVLVVSGDYDIPDGATSFNHCDGVTEHPPRGDEWVRQSKDAQDIRDGFGWNGGGSFPGTKTWVVADEPIGFSEQDIPGKRTTSTDDATAFASSCTFFGAGCAYHSDAGIYSAPLGPKQAAAEAAWFFAQRYVPTDTQFSPYQRGEANGGPGIGNMPMEHLDALALRTFCKAADAHTEYCQAFRTQPGWSAIGRDGWVVVEQSAHGLVKLTR